MVSLGEKAKIKKAENSNQGLSYVITTVQECLHNIWMVPCGTSSDMAWFYSTKLN